MMEPPFDVDPLVNNRLTLFAVGTLIVFMTVISVVGVYTSSRLSVTPKQVYQEVHGLRDELGDVQTKLEQIELKLEEPFLAEKRPN